MSTRPRHRGPGPEDSEYFSASALTRIAAAVADMSWLLGRDYPPKASLALVGDRYQLTERQRIPVMRAAVSDAVLAARTARACTAAQVAGQVLAVDGFNLLITLETAFSGGYVFRGRDGCIRDVSGIHGTYRAVTETEAAIRAAGDTAAALGMTGLHWYLDAPVSNSGRLKVRLHEIASECGWDWQVELVNNPDRSLAAQPHPVISSDAWVLDHSPAWYNLCAAILLPRQQEIRFVDFFSADSPAIL